MGYFVSLNSNSVIFGENNSPMLKWKTMVYLSTMCAMCSNLQKNKQKKTQNVCSVLGKQFGVRRQFDAKKCFASEQCADKYLVSKSQFGA